MGKTKRLSKRRIALIVCASILGAILFTALGFWIAFEEADKIQCYSPDYDKIDLTEILDKPELSDEDYQTLYRQTGLTKTGVDRALEKGEQGKTKIKTIQNNLFEKHDVHNALFAPFVCTDYLADGKQVAAIYLETGDVLVSSSTHISGFRIGHAGLVTDGARGEILQAMAYGAPTFTGRVSDFTKRVNFMVLSPKTDADTKKQVAEYALETFKGTPYEGTIGVFSKKDRLDKTQCAHLVWQSYRKFGLDLDHNGGALVTPKDFANSPEVDIVQVFGFDLDNLWK